MSKVQVILIMIISMVLVLAVWNLILSIQNMKLKKYK
jgi:hypothetical protein